MSKIISKVFKVKIENENIKKNNEKILYNNNNISSAMIINNKEKNKSLIFNKLKSKLGKNFNFYLMNSKIIDNEDENHDSKLKFFLRENILYFFNNFYDNFQEKIDMELPREILSIIINILLEYEVDCDKVLDDFQNLLNKMNLILKKEEKELDPIEIKFKPKRFLNNKKLRKNKLLKKRTRSNKLKNQEKGETKIENYFNKSNIRQEIKFEKDDNSKKSYNKTKQAIKSNEFINFLKDKSSPGFFNFNNINPSLESKSASISQYPSIKSINRQGTYSTIFESEINLNESRISNHMSNRLNESRGSRVSNCKESINQELNYKNYFKSSILKTRNYSQNNNYAGNFDNYSTVSLIESSGQPFNYNYSNVSQISQTNYYNHKLINSFSHLKSPNQSFDDNYSQQRKSSNLTFGFQFSNNMNANNLNNSNILNSSFLNNTDILTNDINMTAGSNTLNEKIYDELNGNFEFKSNFLHKQNSCEAITTNSDNNIFNSENNLQIQISNPINPQKDDKSEINVCSPQNYFLLSNNDNLSKNSSGEFNNKIKKPRGNINYFTHPVISSSKSTNNSIISNSNNSQFSLIQQKSNGNFNHNINSNMEIESTDCVTPFLKKITLSFNDNDSNLLNSSYNCDSQSNVDSENKKANKSYGLNTWLHNRIDNLPKMKKIKNGSAGKKLKNYKKCDNNFINMIFNKLTDKTGNTIREPKKEEKYFSHLNESDNLSIIYSELDSKSSYILREDSESVDINNRNKLVKSDKATQIKEIIDIKKFYKKQIEEYSKKSPEINRSSCKETNTNSAKKYKNLNIKNYLSEEKPRKNSNNKGNNIVNIIENHHQNNEKINDPNKEQALNKRVSAGNICYENYINDFNNQSHRSHLKEITKTNFAESISNIKKRNSEASNSLNKVLLISVKTAETCPTTASGGNSIIKTRRAYISKLENTNTCTFLLNKKRKTYKSTEEINNKIENNENNKNGENIIEEKCKKFIKSSNKNVIIKERQNKEKEKTYIRNTSLASNTDDEILVFQTPDKTQISKVKSSPNSVSRKNLMELFAQIKKN